MLIHLPITFVKETGTQKGRGVFSARYFVVNDVIEVSPVVLVAKGVPVPREIDLLLFNWSYLLTGENGLHSALALGYGSLYNHDNPANMRYEADAQRLELRFIAARNIAEGEELTVNYNGQRGGPISTENDWFDRKKIQLVNSTSEHSNS